MVAVALGLLLVCGGIAQAAQQTLFLSLQDNKHQRRVEALKSMLQRHGGDIRADRFEKGEKGEKGYRYNVVLIAPDKVAEALKKGMGAEAIDAVAAQVTFKSKAGLFSKNVGEVLIDCPETGFEETFSWYKNVLAKDPWTYLKDTYPAEFAKHVKQVEVGGVQKLRVKKPSIKIELVPKGSQATARTIFFEMENKSGDLYYDVEGGE